MTCIAGLVAHGNVFMAADSAGVADLSLTVRKDPKIYEVGEFLIGFTSSFRMGQLLGYAFEPPEHKDGVEIHRYMVTSFVDKLRKTFIDGGYSRNKEGEEQAGDFLVGYRGRLFRICSDYQVGENICGYDAVGCGHELALGSLYTTSDLGFAVPPKTRLTYAMHAAEEFSAGVRGPHLYKELVCSPNCGQ